MCSCCNATFYGQTQKFVKMPKKSVSFDHMLVDGHNTSFENFAIL